MKNSTDILVNRTRDLPVCSAVPQRNAPLLSTREVAVIADCQDDRVVGTCWDAKDAVRLLGTEVNILYPPPAFNTYNAKNSAQSVLRYFLLFSGQTATIFL
jgi:hypothetical protein